MANIFGREYSRAELLAKTGDISQLCRADRCRLSGGRREGVEAFMFSNSSGISFSVISGRGMDIGPFSYKGIPLSWRSAVGEAAPAFYEPEGFGMDRSYHGGLMHLGGLSSAGLPSLDGDESPGLHGRISNIPADEAYTEGGWSGDDYAITLKGRVREATATGGSLQLNRTVRVVLGRPEVCIEDSVENIGPEPAPHMILYHTNFGFPLLDEQTEFIIPASGVSGFDEFSERNIDNCLKFPAPQRGCSGELFYHEPVPDGNGNTCFSVVNRKINEGRGIALTFEYNIDALGRLVEWKYYRSGYYVAELGPSNCGIGGRAAERSAGTLRFLEPRETVDYRFRISVHEGAGPIAAECERIMKIVKG